MGEKHTEAVHGHHARPSQGRARTQMTATPPRTTTALTRLSPSAPIDPIDDSTPRSAPTTTRATEIPKHPPVTLKELMMHAPPTALPELMTLAEICEFLKVKPSYIYSLTATDRIPHRKFGGTLRFVKWEIIAWIDRSRRGPRMSGPTESDS